jgi:hypothetical protein
MDRALSGRRARGVSTETTLRDRWSREELEFYIKILERELAAIRQRLEEFGDGQAYEPADAMDAIYDLAVMIGLRSNE